MCAIVCMSVCGIVYVCGVCVVCVYMWSVPCVCNCVCVLVYMCGCVCTCVHVCFKLNCESLEMALAYF